jgi:hypothetical protein
MRGARRCLVSAVYAVAMMISRDVLAELLMILNVALLAVPWASALGRFGLRLRPDGIVDQQMFGSGHDRVRHAEHGTAGGRKKRQQIERRPASDPSRFTRCSTSGNAHLCVRTTAGCRSGQAVPAGSRGLALAD